MALGGFIPLLFDSSAPAPTVTPPPFCVHAAAPAPLYRVAGLERALYNVTAGAAYPLRVVSSRGLTTLYRVTGGPPEC